MSNHNIGIEQHAHCHAIIDLLPGDIAVCQASQARNFRRQRLAWIPPPVLSV